MLPPAPTHAKKWVASANRAEELKGSNLKSVMGSSPSKAAGLGRPGEASLPKIEANQGTRQGEAGSRQTNIREGSRVRFE